MQIHIYELWVHVSDTFKVVLALPSILLPAKYYATSLNFKNEKMWILTFFSLQIFQRLK